jgi:hypothetical protein
MTDFSLGYRARFPNIESTFLLPSINSLEEQIPVLKQVEPPAVNHADFISYKSSPAENYNELIFECTTPYLILCHEDVSFSPGILKSIQNTMYEVPEFGMLGLVGCDNSGTNRWSNTEQIFEVDTFDSCFIVLRLDYGLKFDSVNFGGLHLYVEDYCARLKNFGKKNYTIKLSEGEYINHHSSTWSTLGPAWGDYNNYKKVFSTLYPTLKTT